MERPAAVERMAAASPFAGATTPDVALIASPNASFVDRLNPNVTSAAAHRRVIRREASPDVLPPPRNRQHR